MATINVVMLTMAVEYPQYGKRVCANMQSYVNFKEGVEVTARRDYFAHFGPSQTLGGTKMGDP